MRHDANTTPKPCGRDRPRRSARPRRPGPAAGLAVVVCALGVAGCEGSGASASPAAVRDTLANGAERVRYGPFPEAAVAPLVEDLRLGVLEGDPRFVFGDVRGVEVGDDGAIYVLDFQAAELRAFGPDGSFRGLVARRGEGPGEISEANGVVRASDGTFWVQDHRRWQLVRLAPDGREVERIPMFVRQYGYMWDGSVDEEGRLWTAVSHATTPFAPPEAGVNEYETRIYVKGHHPGTGAEDSVFVGTDVGLGYAIVYENGYAYRQVPYTPTLVSAADPAGGVWAAWTGEYRVARLDAQGDTVLVIEIDLPPAAVTSADHERLIEEARERDADEERIAREIVRVMPRTKPAVAELSVDDEGRLWVRRFAERGAPPVFDVFARDGTLVGSLRPDFPINAWLRPRVRDGRFYALSTDALDVPAVVRAEIPFDGR